MIIHYLQLVHSFNQTETLAAIKSFITAAELKLNSKVKSFRSDRGGEFMSR